MPPLFEGHAMHIQYKPASSEVSSMHVAQPFKNKAEDMQL